MFNWPVSGVNHLLPRATFRGSVGGFQQAILPSFNASFNLRRVGEVAVSARSRKGCMAGCPAEIGSLIVPDVDIC